jgi:hypothetical protein
MALDYSKLSEEELQAIANNDYSKLSESTLTAIAAEPEEKKKEPGVAETGNAAVDLARNLPMAAYNAPTGINPQVVGEVLSPLKQAIPKTIQTYAAAPWKAGADLLVGSVGLPPPYASTEGVKGLYNTYQGARESLNKASQVMSNTPGNPANYFGMQKAVPEAADILSDLYHNKGGPNAIKEFLKTPQAAEFMKDPKFAAAAESYMGRVPSAFAQAGKVIGPALRGVARVAGPAGMAMNVYDAGEMARETELGQRLAQGQGGRAEQAFRAGPVQSYQGPQINAQQAQNVLQSGSPRDIKYFGGQDQLREQMRRQAAARVTGPVAPGQQ